MLRFPHFGINKAVCALGAVATLTMLSASPALHAEGSFELNDNAGDRVWGLQRSGTGILANVQHRVALFAYAEVGEIVSVGSSATGIGNGDIVMRTPLGGIVSCRNDQPGLGVIADRTEEVAGPNAVGGFIPCNVTATVDGLYFVEFTSPDSTGSDFEEQAASAPWTQLANRAHIAAFDVTVFSGVTRMSGRVFTRYLSLTTGRVGPDPGGAESELFVLTPDGLQYRVDLLGAELGAALIMSSNAGIIRNATGNPLYRSVAMTPSNEGFVLPSNVSVHNPELPDTDRYVSNKIFFNTPDATMPANAASFEGSQTLFRAYVAPTLQGLLSFEGNDGTPGIGEVFPDGGQFVIQTTEPSGFRLDIDLGGGAVATVTGILPVAGTHRIPWDGRDNNGNPVAEGNYSATITVTFLGGEAHFPFFDVENVPNGISIERTNGPGSPNFNLFFNDINIGGANASAGVDSSGGAHVYSMYFGDGAAIENWTLLQNTSDVGNVAIELGPTCRDMIVDQDETDVDCGGDICDACVGGQDCLDNDDCVSGLCLGDGTCSDIIPVCGNNNIEPPENCDDGNPVAGDGCDADCVREPGFSCPTPGMACFTTCGDGIAAGSEICDDGNATGGDGCSANCTAVDIGYFCPEAGGVCTPICGDSRIVGGETCDDGNALGQDGCSVDCRLEPGFVCANVGLACATVCGDGIVAGMETCDDDNDTAGDGCSDTCGVEAGWSCLVAGEDCSPICGDNNVVGDETCDDGGAQSGDGCDNDCQVETGWVCPDNGGDCETDCGDGLIIALETCDDGGTSAGDGCSNECLIEAGFRCTGQPSVCTPFLGEIDLALSAEAPDSFDVGTDDTYALTVENVGTAATTAPVVIIDVLPSGQALESFSPTSWVCLSEGQKVTCTHDAVLDADDQLPALLLSVSTTIAAAPQVTHTATVHSDGDVDIDNNTATNVVSVAADAELSDIDDDGISDASDNCPEVFNPDQANEDGDALGDACDADKDGDGFEDGILISGSGWLWGPPIFNCNHVAAPTSRGAPVALVGLLVLGMRFRRRRR